MNIYLIICGWNLVLFQGSQLTRFDMLRFSLIISSSINAEG